MGLSRLEQETVINYNAAEEIANIYTCQKGLMAKLKKAKWATFVKDERIDGKVVAMEFDVPKKAIKVSLRKPKNLSESQKQVLRDRLKSNLNKVTPRISRIT